MRRLRQRPIGFAGLAGDASRIAAPRHRGSSLPPGTSKWNKIEHRLFSFITQNWRAKPLLSYRVIVELIGATTTQAGLTVRCELDTKAYTKGIAVSDEQMKGINIQPEPFHGE